MWKARCSAVTDKRVVKMQDLVSALAKARIHAADCSTIASDTIWCNCWCNPEQGIEVNG
jgi:hypothetical protein